MLTTITLQANNTIVPAGNEEDAGGQAPRVRSRPQPPAPAGPPSRGGSGRIPPLPAGGGRGNTPTYPGPGAARGGVGRVPMTQPPSPSRPGYPAPALPGGGRGAPGGGGGGLVINPELGKLIHPGGAAPARGPPAGPVATVRSSENVRKRLSGASAQGSSSPQNLLRDLIISERDYVKSWSYVVVSVLVLFYPQLLSVLYFTRICWKEREKKGHLNAMWRSSSTKWRRSILSIGNCWWHWKKP